MKSKFIGYYEPTKDEIKNSWEKGIFAFDANALLNLYRYSSQTREDFILVLKALKEKLFLPFQAAAEFHSNRNKTIEKTIVDYENINKYISNDLDDTINEKLNQYKKHPSIKIDTIKIFFKEFKDRALQELINQKDSHPNFNMVDSIRENITDLFGNLLGEEMSNEDLKKIYQEGEERYKERIPPGYADEKNKEKKGQKHIYGDLIIWKELINRTIKTKTPLIFITDDRKEDWWRIENGKTIGPREELIQEFYDLTQTRILIYNTDQFLKYAKEFNITSNIQLNTINEIKELRVSEEKLNFKIGNAYVQDFNKFSKLVKHWTDLENRMKPTNALIDYMKHNDKFKLNNSLGK